MLKFRYFWTLLICLASAPISYAAEETLVTDKQAAQDFIKDIGNQVIQILVNKEKSLATRQEAFRQVVRSHFDMKAIGRFVLGRYWHQASADQQTQYLQLFENTIVESYSHQFDNYHNEILNVESARLDSDKGITVTSKIVRSQGVAPLQVDWKVFNTAKGLRVLDVIINGVSMSLTYRTQYAGVYSAQGGTMDGLLKAMSSKEIAPASAP